VRIVFNRTESKLDVVVLKEYVSAIMVPKPLCSNLFDCNWTIGVNIETKSSSPPICALYHDINLYYLVLYNTHLSLNSRYVLLNYYLTGL
jgi:hypothetical protein